MKKVIYFILLIFPPMFVCSQNTVSGGFGHFFTGPSNANLTKLNDYFTTIKGLNTSGGVNNTGSIIGGTGYGIKNNFLIGGTGYAAAYGVSQPQDAAITLGFGGGSFNMGYIIYSKSKTFMYPYVGLGAGGIGITIENNGNTDIVLDQRNVIASGKKSSFSYGGSYYEFGYAVKNFPLNKKGEMGGFMLGLEAGVILNVYSDNWLNEEGKKVSGTPAFSPAQSYLRITIGGGAVKHKK